MLAVDTNVLIRLLVDDPGARAQCDRARSRVRAEERLYVPIVSIIEAMWVLSDSYQFPKQEMLRVFEKLLENEQYRIQDEKLISDALATYKSANVDFADCVIHAEARREGISLLTFDRKLARLGGVEILRS